MNRQEIFNRTWEWFSLPFAVLAKIDNNWQGFNEDTLTTNCYYRDPLNNQARCAIGCQIPDSLYTTEMEGKDIGDLFEIWPDLATHFGFDTGEWDDDQYKFLNELQKCHDNSSSVEEMLTRMQELAASEGLVVPD